VSTIEVGRLIDEVLPVVRSRFDPTTRLTEALDVIAT
jgi:hypothetical protein